ncbi:hypothetical protein HOC01_02825 [archaeon]|jgi:hypothetical protein|nr:hypothetical protein [archaeon]MBT6698176.1 hypothetical protein [archaeon]
MSFLDKGSRAIYSGVVSGLAITASSLFLGVCVNRVYSSLADTTMSKGVFQGEISSFEESKFGFGDQITVVNNGDVREFSTQQMRAYHLRIDHEDMNQLPCSYDDLSMFFVDEIPVRVSFECNVLPIMPFTPRCYITGFSYLNPNRPRG